MRNATINANANARNAATPTQISNQPANINLTTPNPKPSKGQPSHISQQLHLPPLPSPPHPLPPNNPHIPHPHRNTHLLFHPIPFQQNTNLTPQTPHKNNLLHFRTLHHTRAPRIIIQPPQLLRKRPQKRRPIVPRQQRLVRMHEGHFRRG